MFECFGAAEYTVFCYLHIFCCLFLIFNLWKIIWIKKKQQSIYCPCLPQSFIYNLKLSQVHGWFTAAYSMSAITVSPRWPLTLRFCHFVMVWRGHSQANFTREWVRVRSTHRHSTIIRPRVWCNPSPSHAPSNEHAH